MLWRFNLEAADLKADVESESARHDGMNGLRKSTVRRPTLHQKPEENTGSQSDTSSVLRSHMYHLIKYQVPTTQPYHHSGVGKNKLKTHWTTLSSHSCLSPKPASAAGIEPSTSVSSGFSSLNTPTMTSARAAFSSPNECRAMGASQLKINCEKLENVSRKLTYVN